MHSAWGGGAREETGLRLVHRIWVKSSVRGRSYFRLNGCVSPVKFKRQIQTLNLIPSVMVFGGGVFGRILGHEGRALRNGFSTLLKGAQRAPSPLLPHEDAEERPTVNQEVGPQQTPNLPAP